MNAVQKVKLAMYNAVAGFCDKNKSIIESVPALQASYTSFTQTVSLITQATQQKEEVLTGIATGKANARKALARTAASLAAQVYAYANAKSLDPLKERVNFSVSGLNRLKDVELPAVCKNILKAAVENETNLATYNVTEQTNADFGDMIAAYEAIEPEPRIAISGRISQTVSLRSLYKAADNILKNEMDKIVAGYISTNPEFFTAYTSTRVIIDASGTPSQIKGRVTAKSTAKPPEAATVAITGTGITVTTDANGKFVIRGLAPGKYTVTISKNGYGALSFPDELVKLGRITRLNGVMAGANE